MVSVDQEIIEEYRKNYPPLINVEQAAEIAHTFVATVHGWSSANRLDEFKVRCGRRILFKRDEYVRFVLGGC